MAFFIFRDILELSLDKETAGSIAEIMIDYNLPKKKAFNMIHPIYLEQQHIIKGITNDHDYIRLSFEYGRLDSLYRWFSWKFGMRKYIAWKIDYNNCDEIPRSVMDRLEWEFLHPNPKLYPERKTKESRRSLWRYKCPCGVGICKSGQTNHYKGEKHKFWLANYKNGVFII